MKYLLSILIAGGVGFAAAYVAVSNRESSERREEIARLEAEWRKEKDALEAALREEQSKPAMIEHVERQVAVAARRDPKAILDNLLTLKPAAGHARIRTIRKIVHELEDLAELNNAALPAIREFLAQNFDLDYASERDRGDGEDRRGWTPPWQRSAPPTEFTLPPSLRIGIFDVLRDIGTVEAQEVLAGVLESSGRAVEVAYVTRALEEIAPGRYREAALAAAIDLLKNPLPIDNPNRLDEQAEGYLYGILELYNDHSFAGEAKRLLVSAEGRVNRNAQQYLVKTQGENAIPIFYEAYKNNAISNTWDRVSVANRILDYAGQNATANAFLSEVVHNPDIDSRMRSFAVMRLAGGFGGMESPTDPNVIRSRIQVVESLRPGIEDERLSQTLDITQRNLQNLLDGKPVENPWSRDREGDRRDRGSDRRGRPDGQSN